MSCISYSCRTCATIFFEDTPCPKCKSVDTHASFDEGHEVEAYSDDESSD